MKKAIFATYDLSFNPLSFDFVRFLAIVRALSYKYDFDEKFYLAIKINQFRNVGIESEYSVEHQSQKCNNVILRTATICSWIKAYFVLRTDEVTISQLPNTLQLPTEEQLKQVGKVAQWQITPMTAKQLATLINNGGKIPDKGFVPNPLLKESYSRKIGNKSIVFHPRCSNFTEERNTPIDLFRGVADHFLEKGFSVTVVPDYEDYIGKNLWDTSGLKMEILPCFDIEHRVAIAESASVNLTWGAGIIEPLHFSMANFLETGKYIKNVQLVDKDYMARKGPEFGAQANWLDQDTQVFDWTEKSDLTSKVLIEKLEEILEKIEEKKT